MNRSRPFGNEPGHPVQEELHLPILRLREEIESLQREIESGAGGGDPGDSPTRPRR